MKYPKRIIRRVIVLMEDGLDILDRATDNNFLTKKQILELEKGYDCLLEAQILLKEGRKK
jgi:hypothetical protein